jgi:peptidoglycan/LPS O-acetylase OafA/YrhL
MLVVRHWLVDSYTWFVVLVMFIGYGIVCLDTFDSKTILSRIFSYNPMRWYGNMSYSYYLIHGITLKFLFLVLGVLLPADKQSDWIFYSFFLPFFVITLVSSFILFYFVEKRFSFKKNK